MAENSHDFNPFTPPSSASTPVTSGQKMQPSTNPANMEQTAFQMGDIMKMIIDQRINSRVPKYVLCEVIKKVSPYHYDLSPVASEYTSGNNHIMHAITNATSFELNPGDYVYVLAIDGKLNTSFIICKIIPYYEEINNDMNARVGEISATYTETVNKLIYDYNTSKWLLMLSENFYQDYLSGESIVQIGIYRKVRHRKSKRLDEANPEFARGGSSRYTYPQYINSSTIYRHADGGGYANYSSDPSQNTANTKSVVKFAIVPPNSDGSRYIDVTDIVNRYVLTDSDGLRTGGTTQRGGYGPIQLHYNKYGFWFNKFGIYIKDALGKKNFYQTPINDFVEIDIFTDDINVFDGYTESNITISNNKLILLS